MEGKAERAASSTATELEAAVASAAWKEAALRQSLLAAEAAAATEQEELLTQTAAQVAARHSEAEAAEVALRAELKGELQTALHWLKAELSAVATQAEASEAVLAMSVGVAGAEQALAEEALLALQQAFTEAQMAATTRVSELMRVHEAAAAVAEADQEHHRGELRQKTEAAAAERAAVETALAGQKDRSAAAVWLRALSAGTRRCFVGWRVAASEWRAERRAETLELSLEVADAEAARLKLNLAAAEAYSARERAERTDSVATRDNELARWKERAAAAEAAAAEQASAHEEVLAAHRADLQREHAVELKSEVAAHEEALARERELAAAAAAAERHQTELWTEVGAGHAAGGSGLTPGREQGAHEAETTASLRRQLDSTAARCAELEWKYNALREHCETLQDYSAELSGTPRRTPRKQWT